MIETLFSDGNRHGFKISGHIGIDELEQLYTAIEDSLDEFDKTHLYVEVAGYKGFDTQFFARNSASLCGLLGKLSAFGRVAFVADRRWLRTAAKVESALLPHIAYEVYPLAERDLALEWVKGESRSAHRPGLSIIATDRDDVVAFVITGRLEADDLHRISNAIETALEDHDKISLLGRFERYSGVDITSLGDAEYLRMKKSMIGRLDRYALIGAPGWLASLANGFSILMPGEIRSFDAQDEEAAWQWLDASPAGPQPSRGRKEDYLVESGA